MSGNPIEFGIGGNNEGFSSVLGDTLKKAKATSAEITATFDKIKFGEPNGSSGGMSKKFLAEKDKISAGTKDLTAEFHKSAGISSAFGDTLGKIGSLAKGGAGGILAGVTALAAFGKAAYDAHQAAGALDLAIEKFGKRNAGGAENKFFGDIESNLSDIREQRKKLFDQNRHKGEAFQGVKDWLDSAKVAVSDTLETGVIGGGATAKRDAALRQEEMRALEQLGEKQKIVTGIVRERVSGSKEEAEIMALQVEYAEKIDKARDKGKGSAGQVQALTDERDLKMAEVRRAAESARIARAGSFAESYIVGRDAGKTDNVQLAQAKLDTAQSLAANAGSDEDKKNAEAVVKSAEAALKVAEHEEEVRSRISRNDLDVANLRGSMANRQEMALRKQVELSQTLFSLAKSRIEKEERGVALARDKRALEEYQTQRQQSEIDSDTGMANSRIGAINSRAWRTNSAEGETRTAMASRVLQAKQSLGAADDKLNINDSTREDINLINAKKKAEDDLTVALEAQAKWERDIARSKSDALISATAANAATQLSLAGNTRLAEQLRARVANELAIVNAHREGNTELEEQLKTAGDLAQKSIMRSRIMGGGTVRSAQQIANDERQEARTAAEADRVAARIEKSGMPTVGRSAVARSIIGVRPATTQITGETSMTSKADWDAQFKQRGIGAMLTKREMESKGHLADIGHSRAEKSAALTEAKLKAVAAGTASPEQAISRVAQLLEAWNN